MAKGFRNGPGGVSQNFKVVGGTSQPANPSENTIWVNTDVTITDYKLSKNEPKNPTDGLVWISLGENSGVAFHTLKMADIEFDEVCPISTKQYVNGAWVDKTAKSYQSGKWVDWIRYLYKYGDKCESISNGWSSDLTGQKFAGRSLSKKEPTFGSNSIILDLAGLVEFYYVPIITGWLDLKNIKTIHVRYSILSQTYDVRAGISTSKTIENASDPDIPVKVRFGNDVVNNAVISIDVTNAPDEGYFVLWSFFGAGTDPKGKLEIHEIWME